MRAVHLVTGAMFAVVLSGGGIGAAHTRDYANANVLLTTCNDSQESLGFGGIIGGTVQAALGAVDPFAPDQGGTCYRRNHIRPNANGDVGISGSDHVQTNVGLCVSQDSDGDGFWCNDDGDVQVRGCNSVNIHVHFDPSHNVFIPNAWRFQDSQGPPSRVTWVAVNFYTESNSIFGPHPDCGPGVDAFGIWGDTNHL